MAFYIYLTTNLINGKQYIGQHKGELNDSYLGSGTNILKAINKYGKENFKKEILQICENRLDADKWEQYYIEKFNAVENDNFYNLQEGGTGGDGWRACQRWLQTHPEEAKNFYERKAQNLKKWAEEHPEEYQQKVIAPFLEGSKKYWKNHPKQREELMKKVNQAKEKWQQEHPEEHQKQVEQWRQAGSKANSQKVRCITTNEIFESQSAAARFYGIPQTNISKCLRGERKSAGKHPITKEKLLWELVEKK